MINIKLIPETLTGDALRAFFAFLQAQIITTEQCYVLHAHHPHTFNEDETNRHLNGNSSSDDNSPIPNGNSRPDTGRTKSQTYIFTSDYLTLCRIPTVTVKTADVPPVPHFQIDYIDETELIGKGNFSKIYPILTTYRCDGISFTNITATSRQVVKVQSYCLCPSAEESACLLQHNPQVLIQQESTISHLIPRLGTQQIVFEPMFHAAYMTMNYLPGVTLEKILVADRKGVLILNFDQRMILANNLLVNILELSKLNILHGDLKPENIIVDSLKLTMTFIDFRFAELFPSGTTTIQRKNPQGTPLYSTLEQLNALYHNTPYSIHNNDDMVSCGRIFMRIFSRTKQGFDAQSFEKLIHYVEHDLLKLTHLFLEITAPQLTSTIQEQFRALLKNMLEHDFTKRSNIQEAIIAFTAIKQAINATSYTASPPTSAPKTFAQAAVQTPKKSSATRTAAAASNSPAPSYAAHRFHRQAPPPPSVSIPTAPSVMPPPGSRQ